MRFTLTRRADAVKNGAGFRVEEADTRDLAGRLRADVSRCREHRERGEDGEQG